MSTVKNNKIIKLLQFSPFHPQWHIYRTNNKLKRLIANRFNEIILDIGCADKSFKSFLKDSTKYIGLDYLKTANNMYITTPDLYADGQKIPFKDQSINNIAALEVLEHLPNPQECIKESYRVLANDGNFVLSTPFIYPIHDAPYDFRRWTKYGLKNILKSEGFLVKEILPIGTIGETISLITNIGLAKLCINFYKSKNIFGLLVIPLFLVVIPIINLAGYLLGLLLNDRDFMPYGYICFCEKK